MQSQIASGRKNQIENNVDLSTRRHACDIAEIHLMDRDWLRSVPKSVRQESLAPEGAGENQSGGKP